jgi:SAM-dependent MidA family methyltransferase
MTDLAARLSERIRTSGPITFADYMAAALYDPDHGYYAAGPERSGWHGDFVTSAELHPSFGQLWCEFFARVWSACGRPPRFDVVEIGPGEGALASAVLTAASGSFAEALRIRLVEPLAPLRRRQEQKLGCSRVTWSTTLEVVEPVTCGCVFANEVLDNLPVHVVEQRDGALVEIFVDARDHGLEFVARPPSTPALADHLAWLGVSLRDGERLEVPLAGVALARRAAAVVERGAVVFVDYGTDATDERRRAGTLVTYTRAGADDLVLERPGSKDVTAHVDWASLRATLRAAGLETIGPRSQRSVLHALGLHSADAHARAQFDRAARRGAGRDALAALSRRSALGALADRGGLGGLGVLFGLRGVDATDVLGRDEDRP